MNSRQQQKQDTKEKILQASRELFEELGFEKTTTRAIAQRAKVATGTVFAHYPDKISLLIHALHNNIDHIIEDAMLTQPKEAPIIDHLLYFTTAFIKEYTERHDLSRTLLSHAMFQGAEEAQLFNQQRESFIKLIADLLEQAKNRGEVNVALNAQLAAQNYMAAHFYVVIGALNDDNPNMAQLTALMRALIEQQLYGYLLDAP